MDKVQIQQQLKTLINISNYYLNVGKDKQRTVAYIYIILSLLSLSFFGLFAIGPTISTISELNREYENKQVIYKKLKDKNSALSSLSNQYSSIQPDLSLINNAIPDSPNVSRLTRQIETLSTKNNLVMRKIDTGLLEIYPAKNVNSPIFSFLFSVTVDGEEKDINNFIAEITNIDRIIGIERLSTGVERSAYTAAVTGRAFFYNP